MGRTNKDVGGYRGRRTITDILRFIAIALAVVVVLVLAGVFYLQKYLVYRSTLSTPTTDCVWSCPPSWSCSAMVRSRRAARAL